MNKRMFALIVVLLSAFIYLWFFVFDWRDGRAAIICMMQCFFLLFLTFLAMEDKRK